MKKYLPARSTRGPPVQNAIVWNKTRGLDGIGDWSATDLCKDCCILVINTKPNEVVLEVVSPGSHNIMPALLPP